jgi:hypothetical protein
VVRGGGRGQAAEGRSGTGGLRAEAGGWGQAAVVRGGGRGAGCEGCGAARLRGAGVAGAAGCRGRAAAGLRGAGVAGRRLPAAGLRGAAVAGLEEAWRRVRAGRLAARASWMD